MAETTREREAYLLESARTLKADFELRNQAILRKRNMRINADAVPVPKELEAEVNKAGGPYHAPHCMFLIRATQGLLGPKLPRAIRASADKKKSKANRTATKIEKWLNQGAYPKLFRRVQLQVTDSMAESGWGVWKLRSSRLTWGELMKDVQDEKDPKKVNQRNTQVKRDNFLFSASHVSPSTFYPKYEDEKLIDVYEITRRKKADMYRTYKDELRAVGAIIEEGSPSLTGDVECIEHYDEHHVDLIVDGHLLKTVEYKSRRNCPPYYVAFFSPTGIKDPEWWTESITGPIEEAQRLVQLWMTRKNYWASMVEFPGFKMEQKNPDAIPDLDEDTKVEWGAMKTTKVPAGWGWDPTKFPGTADDLNQSLTYLLQTISDHSLAPVLLGQNTGRISTANQQSQVQLAKAIFGTAMEEIASAWSDMAGDMLWYIEHELKDSVPVEMKDAGDWLEIGPDDIDGDYHVTHELTPVLKIEDIIAGTFGMSMYDKGAITKRRLTAEYGHVEDPDEELDARMVEDIVGHPQILQMILEVILQKIEAKKQPVAQRRGVMGGNAPPAGSGMPGGTGMAMNPGQQRVIAQGVAPIRTAGPPTPLALPAGPPNGMP